MFGLLGYGGGTMKIIDKGTTEVDLIFSPDHKSFPGAGIISTLRDSCDVVDEAVDRVAATVKRYNGGS